MAFAAPSEAVQNVATDEIPMDTDETGQAAARYSIDGRARFL
jgi:hypothetical protein